jgi:hypothetical protein
MVRILPTAGAALAMGLLLTVVSRDSGGNSTAPPGSTPKSSTSGKGPVRARCKALAVVATVGGYTVPTRPTPSDAIVRVDLRKTRVTDDDLEVIAGLGYVQHLDLGETSITDRGVRHLVRMKRLDSLRLANTKITAESLKHILRVPGLAHLGVSRTAVQESDLAVFAGHIPPTHYFGGFAGGRAWMMPGPFNASDWVTASDGKLSLRLLAPRAPLVPEAPLLVLAEVRNDSPQAMNVLRPCGDEPVANGAWVTIRGPHGLVRYSGPAPSYVLGGAAFETIRPGQVIRDIMVLPVDMFGGSDARGTYEITFRYAPSSSHQKTAAGPGIDKKHLWTGQIPSKAVTIRKE